MSTLNYIIDEPLPLNQDYKSLKKEGLGYIQAYSGNEWTNLNPADPGVTILDQLCFALTELGYCNDFSISDILTGPDEKLEIKDQFYLPEEILTTSPLTIQDYRKYLIDAVEEVQNVIINTDATATVKGAYQVYLLIDPLITDQKQIDNICHTALFCLNKRRNLGELFLLPSPLQVSSYLLNGRIEIDNAANLDKYLAQMQSMIRNYIFPAVVQYGYEQLIEKGVMTDEIFNGPLLSNGWIPSDSLGEKRDLLHVIDLVNLIGSLQGITSVANLSFSKSGTSYTEIQSNAIQVLAIDVISSVENGTLEIWYKGKKLSGNPNLKLNSSLRQSPIGDTTILFGAAIKIQTELPKGKFRDIHTYYSIQNTFPEIFAVGANAITSNATDFQIAQSRQLKGYLLLFDQLLANQFAQLASINKLFSFKNSSHPVYPRKAALYGVKETFKKKSHEYPVPYRAFSPTYFCQPLYDVPNIKPLLKDNDTFKFSITIEPEKELEHKAWKAYKHDPYNPYIKGLMELMEDESTSLERRNNILDHLLARHGESPFVINSIIDGSLYSSNSLKDQVIFKSLYLQNLGLLSYFRAKAYNYIAATKISSDLPEVPASYEQDIFDSDSTDFIVDSTKIDRIEKLSGNDFTNYSALELKLNLLFGLKTQYRDYIANNYDDKKNVENIKLAFWMIQQRKGIFLIENNLLFKSNEPGFTNCVEVILPDFIPQFNTPEFKNRLDLFLYNTLPVQVVPKCHFVSSDTLKKIIPAFVTWHNSLIYNDKNNDQNNAPADNRGALIGLLYEINRLKNEGNQ